jgi:DNA-binding MarR family transcriptional regulator
VAAATTRDTTAAREAQQLFLEIWMAERAQRGAVLAELGLTFAQAHALRLLEPERPLPMSKLAKHLFCDASNVTGIADRLEARGLIERRAAEGDRRVKGLALTPEGVAMRKQVLDVIAEPPPAIAGLSPADQRALRDILRRAVELLRSA